MSISQRTIRLAESYAKNQPHCRHPVYRGDYVEERIALVLHGGDITVIPAPSLVNLLVHGADDTIAPLV